jgi:hypothetical protein
MGCSNECLSKKLAKIRVLKTFKYCQLFALVEHTFYLPKYIKVKKAHSVQTEG